MKNNLRLTILSILLLFTLSTKAQNIRGYYLQDVGTWLGNTVLENEILTYTQGNGFNYILFYDLGQINWNNSAQKNQLAAFMNKARTQYGIIQIGGVVEYAGYVSQFLLPYNNSRTSNTEKFDVINMEFEFWLSASAANYYCTKFLSSAGYSCDLAGAWQFAWREFKLIDDLCLANSLMSEIYLGWPDLSQMQQLASRADRILLAAYRQNDGDIYAYSKPRLMDIASIGGSTKVITLLSSESVFMGPWLSNHPQTQPYQTLSTAFNAETAAFKQNINLQGYQWFTYKFMPKTILGTATITASGPLSFCPSGSVTLTANPGSAYLWSPGGQTTQSITTSTAGSYTVSVTNATGLAVVSLPVQVTISGAGITPTVSVSGSTSFCPGGFVTLTSSQANSYLWSSGATTQAITVSNSGTYYVRTGSGSCLGTSANVTVNSSSSPTTPVITANGSLNICQGSLRTLTSSPSNGYLWSNGATTRSIVISSPGSYSVKAFTGPNCYAQSAVKTITTLSAPTKPIITAGGSTTLTTSNPSVMLTSSTASTYFWSTTDITRTITVTTQGKYRVTITGSNGCTSTSNDVTVIANGCTPPATPVITSIGSSIITSGQSIVITSSLSGGYLWSTGEQTRSITVSAAGSYSVRSYSKGGCYSTSLPFNVTVVLARLASTKGNDQTENISGNSEESFIIYPNPATELLNVEFNQSENKLISILMIDASGRIVKNMDYSSVVGENKIELNLTGIPHGMYYLRIVGDNRNQMKKVVVE